MSDEVFGWVDYNNDGFLDLFKACGDGTPTPNFLYRNSLSAAGNANHWLKVQLRGTASNRSAIGARIWVSARIGGRDVRQVRQIMSSCYGGGNMGGLLAHFGLGDATKVDLLRIEWPSGNVQELTDQTPDRPLTVTEQGFVTPTRPSASLNGSVTLTRVAVSEATYQWRFNGADLAGQTDRILNLTNLIAEQEGRYSVVASSATTLITNFVYLHVDTNFTKIAGLPSGGSESGWGCNWVDYDDDGDLDLLVVNGCEASRNETNGLYRNDGQLGFTRMTGAEAGPIATDADRWFTAAWGDYDNDGKLDLLISYHEHGTNTLYHNLGNGTFEARTLGARTTGGQPVWGDFDSDGCLDLLLTRGQNTAVTNLFWRGHGDGTFTPVTLGSLVTEAGKSVAGACGDYDNDGFLDIFLSRTQGTPDQLYHNNGNANHWLMVKLVGTRSNRAAIGAKVHAQATINGKTFWQMREVPGGNRCQNDLRPHFGLGDATNVTSLQVDWPGGPSETLTNVTADQILTIVEPSLGGAFGTDGKFHLTAYGNTNRTYVVEWSADLLQWSTLATVPGQGPSAIDVADDTLPAAQQRFYRLR